MLVDEMRLEAIPVLEGFGAEEAVVSRLILAGVSVVVGPTGFGGDEKAVVTAEEELVVGGHKRTTWRWRGCGAQTRVAGSLRGVVDGKRGREKVLGGETVRGCFLSSRILRAFMLRPVSAR
jgi:hypothetical protein